MEQLTNKCARCGTDKPSDCFGKQARKANGLHSYCKDCVKAYSKARYDADPQAAIERSRKWNAANPERFKANADKSAEKHKPRRAAEKKIYRTENAEHYRAVRVAWELANREALNEYQRNYTAANPGLARENYWKDPVAARNRSAARRALKVGASIGEITPSGLASRIAYYGGKCWMCGAPYAHLDHVKPLAKGGAHMLANLRPACAPCNLAKSDKWPFELAA